MYCSYVNTDKKTVVADLQGVDYNLCDPEIATMDLLNEGELNFCAGNFSQRRQLKNIFPAIFAINIAK